MNETIEQKLRPYRVDTTHNHNYMVVPYHIEERMRRRRMRKKRLANRRYRL